VSSPGYTLEDDATPGIYVPGHYPSLDFNATGTTHLPEKKITQIITGFSGGRAIQTRLVGKSNDATLGTFSRFSSPIFSRAGEGAMAEKGQE